MLARHKDKSFDLLDRYCEKHLGPFWRSNKPLWLSGDEALSALWPLNELFRPNHHQIRSLSYDPSHEREADKVIERMYFLHHQTHGQIFLPVLGEYCWNVKVKPLYLPSLIKQTGTLL